MDASVWPRLFVQAVRADGRVRRCRRRCERILQRPLADRARPGALRWSLALAAAAPSLHEPLPNSASRKLNRIYFLLLELGGGNTRHNTPIVTRLGADIRARCLRDCVMRLFGVGIGKEAGDAPVEPSDGGAPVTTALLDLLARLGCPGGGARTWPTAERLTALLRDGRTVADSAPSAGGVPTPRTPARDLRMEGPVAVPRPAPPSAPVAASDTGQSAANVWIEARAEHRVLNLAARMSTAELAVCRPWIEAERSQMRPPAGWRVPS